MNWKRGGLAACALWLAGGLTFAAERPWWCREGYVCVPTEDIAADTEYHIKLRSELAALKAKHRRFGLTIGCGFGLAATVADDWSTQVAPAGTCAVVYGLRF